MPQSHAEASPARLRDLPAGFFAKLAIGSSSAAERLRLSSGRAVNCAERAKKAEELVVPDAGRAMSRQSFFKSPLSPQQLVAALYCLSSEVVGHAWAGAAKPAPPLGPRSQSRRILSRIRPREHRKRRSGVRIG